MLLFMVINIFIHTTQCYCNYMPYKTIVQPQTACSASCWTISIFVIKLLSWHPVYPGMTASCYTMPATKGQYCLACSFKYCLSKRASWEDKLLVFYICHTKEIFLDRILLIHMYYKRVQKGNIALQEALEYDLTHREVLEGLYQPY